MKIQVAKMLKINKDKDDNDDYNDYFEVEVDDDITLYLTNDMCYAATVKAINDDNILIEDENGRKFTILFNMIENIEL